MSVRLLAAKKARDIRPGNKVEVFGEYYWVRYINYHGKLQLTLRLQPESEPLSPVYENDKITITVPHDLSIDVEV